MPSPCLYINPADSNLLQKVKSLQKVPGLCVFVDICGSTQMKCTSLQEWVAKIHNCFSSFRYALPLLTFSPIKSIGDALMYYIEEPDLVASGHNALEIYDDLWQIALERDPAFPEVKIGAAWCQDVFPICFLEGSRDYYGIDIDLTARLQSLAQPREVVIDIRLYEKVSADFKAAANQDNFASIKRLIGPEGVFPKGIPREVRVYRGR